MAQIGYKKHDKRLYSLTGNGKGSLATSTQARNILLKHSKNSDRLAEYCIPILAAASSVGAFNRR